MKICQIATYFPYREHLEGKTVEKGYHIGGVERHVYHISKELSELGHSVTVFTTKSPAHDKLSEVPLQIRICRVPSNLRVYTACLPFTLFKSLRRDQYDVIHAHTPVPAIADFAAIQNTRKKKPFVLTYHNDIGKAGFLGSLITKAYNGTMGNLLLRHADLVIATSRSYATNSPRLNRLEKVRVIPNGVDHEEFHPALDGNMVASKHGLNNRRKVVLFVGKIDEYKGCEYLVRAFALVARKFADSRLLVVGEGPLRIKMSKLARDLQISSQVIFTGKVSDSELPSYYAACDVFVLPSISFQEGFGMVQLEAMASAKPVITTTIPGVREVDPDGVATIHVPPKSEQALASAITALLQDDELREKMSKNAREKAEQYSWKRVVRKLEEVYEETSTRAPSVA